MSLNIPNLDKLITHLEAQPPERINMAWGAMVVSKHYGECGCIIAHANVLSDDKGWDWIAKDVDLWPLFTPNGWSREDNGKTRRYPAHRVIATLKRLRDHYLATGEVVVDWGPEPGSEPAQSWSPPKIAEQTLPVEITRLLGSEAVETVETVR